jgi:anti-sigma regulatory factor (Ser/Thr protein kinase)
MTIQEIVTSVAKSKKIFKTADVMNRVSNKFSRQYVSAVISRMFSDGILIKEGSGRWTTYALPEYKDYLGHRITRKLELRDLKEHEVLDGIMRVSTLLKRMPENVQSVFSYAFSEMLNNAIDHSRSEHAEVLVVEETDHTLKFEINDHGIGVFRNAMKERALANELEAMQDLLKGKTTTAPQAHSGEGIFFTSKTADVFILESYGYRLRIDNKIKDIFFEKLNHKLQGTKVTFTISTNSNKHLIDMFTKYQTNPDEPAFDKTEIQIRLYTMGTIYISRSQARRVLSGLDKFKTVTFDFTNVPTIGQAFADEIFRVYKNAHSDIDIIPVNMNEAVSFMVARAQA